MLKKTTFDFLTALAKNNDRDWFNQHRDDYQATLEDFTSFVQDLINEISKFDQTIARSELQAKDCIPRLHRDLRFSKDKSPYKTYFYAIINEGGRKSGKAGYFVVLNPGECYIGGGAYQPDPLRLKKTRQEIDYNPTQWKSIAEDTQLLKAFPDGITAQESLIKVPSGFDAESPVRDFLKMKGFFVRNYCQDSFLRNKENWANIIEAFKACQKLNRFVNAI